MWFFATFEEQLQPKHPLYLLANAIDWKTFEKAFSPLYSSENGAPAKPIRRMAELLILKHIRNLSEQQRFNRSNRQQKLARKANRKIKTIAGRLVRELERKLLADSLTKHFSSLPLFKKVLFQKRHESNKIYSLHEPQTQYISKGKAHKKYKFGNKVSLMQTKNSGVIVGVLSMEKNDYDGHTIEPALQQYQRLHQWEPKKAIVDLGYRRINKIGATEIITPNKKGQTSYEKTQLRNAHRRHSAIEAGISHLKNYYRLGRNFYRYTAG